MSDEEVNKTPHNLAFKVAKFSSEDVSMRAKDLLQLGPGVKGWACSKYSSYPQELIFQLMHRSKVTEIQLLAHQYMIPEQIDIYIGDIQPGKEYVSNNCKYAQLGDVFMSNNEHTQFSGRELKYINVSCTGRYLKLCFHQNHMNKLNIHNQVKQKSRRSLKATGSQKNSESARATISSQPTRASSAPPRRHRTKTSTSPERTETASAPLPKLKTRQYDLSQPSTPRLRSKRIFVPSSEKHNRLTHASGSKSDYELDLDSSEFNQSQKEFRPKEGSNRRSGFHKQKFANIFNSF